MRSSVRHGLFLPGLLVVFGLLLPGAALQAQPNFDTAAIERLAKRLFYKMDMDKNGEVSRAEYEHTEGGGFNVDYDQLDKNEDDRLTWDEYIASVRNFHPGGPPKHTL